jgi:hypothetical protein
MGLFTPFGAELAGIAGRLGSMDEKVASFEERAWMHAACAQLRGFVDAKVAAVTIEDERDIRRGPGPNGNGPAAGPTGAQPSPEPGPEPEPDLPPVPPPPPESPQEMRRRMRRAKWLQRCERFAAALQAGRSPQRMSTPWPTRSNAANPHGYPTSSPTRPRSR